jgi:organic hydroperoxide reductase OsmC/OhrA
MNSHQYALTCRWTGDRGEGTQSYRAYARDHRIEIDGKPVIEGSSDPAFLGAAERLNPEDLLLASISACHMLWYLHLCAANKLVLRDYVDAASAVMEEAGDGGAFTEAVLQPRCRFDGPVDEALAARLHHDAHERCYIANSVNFPIRVEPVIENGGQA